MNNKFSTLSIGLTSAISGGLIYNVIEENYQIYWKKKSYDKLKTPNKILDYKLSSIINIGSVIGGMIGLSYGYFNKPLINLLLKKT